MLFFFLVASKFCCLWCGRCCRRSSLQNAALQSALPLPHDGFLVRGTLRRMPTATCSRNTKYIAASSSADINRKRAGVRPFFVKRSSMQRM